MMLQHLLGLLHKIHHQLHQILLQPKLLLIAQHQHKTLKLPLLPQIVLPQLQSHLLLQVNLQATTANHQMIPIQMIIPTAILIQTILKSTQTKDLMILTRNHIKSIPIAANILTM